MALKAEEFNVDNVVDVCRTEESAHKDEQNMSGKYVHKVSNNYENKRGRSTQRRHAKRRPSWRYGRDGSTFSTKRIKANRIMQTVLAADFVTLGSPVRHKQDNATIVKRLDTSRNFVK